MRTVRVENDDRGAPDERRRVAIFGGSFNPPHVAHVLAAVYALSTSPIDAVLVVPVYRHPFAKELASFEERMEMCRLAFGWIPRVEISGVESELGGESFTLHTLEHLAAQHPDWALRLLVGADVLPDLPRWHRFERIAEIAPPLVLGRAGITIPTGPQVYTSVPAVPPRPLLPAISSTEVRAAFASGDLELVRTFVPAAVVDFAVARGLYQGAKGE
jgi:nicotinate-nucleotide adenylyltransferase